MIVNLETIARELEKRQRATRLDARSRLWKPRATPATDLGYRCKRRIVLHRTAPEKAAPLSEGLASIFTEGNLHQRDVRQELATLGCEVVESELNFYDDRLDVSGTIDGKVILRELLEALGMDPGDIDHRERKPLEIKSTGGDPPRTDEALKNHRGLYGRYWCQMQTYLYLAEEWDGLFLFKSKQTGLWTLVPTYLDLTEMEHLAQKAERVRDHVRAGTLPDRLADRSECASCPWKDTICHPEEEAIDPMLLAVDKDLEDQILERERLDPDRKRFKKLDDELKARFKMTKGDRFMCGDFVITKRPHGRGVRVDFKRQAEKAAEDEGGEVEKTAHPLEEMQ
jgi:hypothetical protein